MKHFIIMLSVLGFAFITISPSELAAGRVLAAELESADIILTQAGNSDYTIVLSKEASLSEKHAAQELQKFLCEISGAELPIITEDQNLPERMIVLGNGQTLQSLNVSIDFKDLGDEGFAIQRAGPQLIIAGGRLRGTMYGVYTFLEEVLGCRWYTSHVSYIPKSPDIILKSLSIVQKPDFEYREPFYTDAWDPDWAARNKANGRHHRLDDQRGGKISYMPFVHSFDDIIPKAKYFEEHPEYFSLIDGVRKGGQYDGQLCLMNPDVQRIALETVMRWMDENPKITIFTVSQNDNRHYCRCEKCAAVDAEEGSPSGLMLRFVNRIAAEAALKHPDKLVDTLAYQYTEKPPKVTKPLANVRIRLCPIDNCQNHPYEKRCCEANAAFMNNLQEWVKLTDVLYIWHYNTNFHCYLLPLPDLVELAADLPLYKQSGVKGVFMQGTWTAAGEVKEDKYGGSTCAGPGSPLGGGGFMDDLKQYLIAKLAWNTKADSKAIIADFLDGFYGKSGKPIGEFLDLLHEKVRKDNVHGFVFSSPDETAELLTPEIMANSERLFDEAERVADNEDILARVKHARLSLESFKIAREVKRVGASGVPQEKAETLRKVEDFAARCKANGILRWSEGDTVDEIVKKWSAPLRSTSEER